MKVTAKKIKNEIEESQKHAEEKLAGIPLPTLRDENYRFTPIPPRCLERFPKREDASKISFSSNKPHPEIYMADFHTALEEKYTLTSYLSVPSVFENDLFAQLVSARWQQSVFLYVPPGTKVSLPLNILYWFNEGSGAFYYRTLLIVDQNSEITLIEEMESDIIRSPSVTPSEARNLDPSPSTQDDDSVIPSEARNLVQNPFLAGLTQVHLLKGAKMHYSLIQKNGPRVHHFLRQHFLLEENAEALITQVNLGGGRTQIRSEAFCEQPNSKIKFLGAVHGSQTQQFDFWTSTHHQAPQTSSELDFWTVMQDRSRVFFNGTINILKNAPKTDAYQKSYNLLLSPQAEVQTSPKLEIATDDIRCSHGASTTPLNEEQIYYLKSRGIPQEEVEMLLILGFIDPVLQALPTQNLQNQIQALLQERIQER